ncbi:helix-turn-helix domain-containing protein [Vibrio ostreicida]|uniref:helix-turn-helix domain-containing protein n=1 Tax=Vibrio ostreicida TaxID=526588 RepID=UPI001FEC9F76|nr:S24 family peptidase [Vibrio ostreicida]
MKEWFLSTELVGIEAMPNSSSGVAQKARRNNWLARSSKVGTRALEYHISNFHPDVKKQLIEKYVTDNDEAQLLMGLSPPSKKPVMPSIAEILEHTTLTEETLEIELKKFVTSSPDGTPIDEFIEQMKPLRKEHDKDNVTELSNVKSVKLASEMGEMCGVPVYNVYASCGFGAQNDTEYQLRKEFLPCIWLKRFGLTEETARIIICHGDSMEDTLSDGDEVLVDTRELEHPVKHGVYVVRIGKHVYIKRLKYDIMAEGYEVISDNKEEYDSFIVNEEKLNEFAVIGKVVTTVMKTVV